MAKKYRKNQRPQTKANKEQVYGYGISGISTEKRKAVQDRLKQAGYSPSEVLRLMAAGQLTDDMTVDQMVSRSLGDHSTVSDSGPNLVPPNIGATENRYDFRELWIRYLQRTGLDRVQSERIVNNAHIVQGEIPTTTLERIKQSSLSLGISIPGQAFKPASSQRDFEQQWVNFLTERGVGIARAERVVKNAKIKPGEASEVAWDRILDSAFRGRIKLPERSYTDAVSTPDLTAPIASNEISESNPRLEFAVETASNLSRQLSDFANGIGGWAERVPTPGDITGPLTALIILWFVFIPVLYIGKTGYTRLHLMWMATIGQAKIIDPNPPIPPNIAPGPIATAAVAIADAASAVEDVATAISGTKKTADKIINAPRNAVDDIAGAIKSATEEATGLPKEVGSQIINRIQSMNPFAESGPP